MLDYFPSRRTVYPGCGGSSWVGRSSRHTAVPGWGGLSRANVVRCWAIHGGDAAFGSLPVAESESLLVSRVATVDKASEWPSLMQVPNLGLFLVFAIGPETVSPEGGRWGGLHWQVIDSDHSVRAAAHVSFVVVS